MKKHRIIAVSLAASLALPAYPGIEDDDRRTLHTCEMLKPAIRPAHRTEHFGMEAKRNRVTSEGVNAWVDPEGYRRFVAAKRRAFEDEVDAEVGVANRAKR